MFRNGFVLALMIAGSMATASEASAQWRAVPYDSANFAGSDSMVWTVEEADQVTFKYMINDRTMTVALILNATSVSGPASQYLRIRIPAGHTGGSMTASLMRLRKDSGAPFSEIASAYTFGGNDWISIMRPDHGNQQLSSNATYIYLTMTFDIE